MGGAVDQSSPSPAARSARARRRGLGVAVLVVGALVLAACSNSGTGGTASGDGPSGAPAGTTPGTVDASQRNEKVALDGVPGVTDDEIRYAAIGVQSNNPLGTCVLDCFLDGVNAYFAYRNDEGGIYGRKLVVSDVLDDELAKNQERALEVVSNDDAFGVFNAGMLASGYTTLDDAGIPSYVWAINFPDMNGLDSVFGHAPAYCVSCLHKSDVYAAKQGGATKVAALGYGVTQNSKDCVEGQRVAIDEYGDELGMQLVYANDELPFGLANGIAPEVTAMKDAGVDFIVTCIDLNGTKTLAQELERQGMGSVPMLHNNTYDAAFVADAGGVFDGDIMAPRFRPFESANEGALATYNQWMEQTGADVTELSMEGWIDADLAYQGLLAAGPELSREKVIAATNGMTGYSADGLINPIDWSRQHVMPTPDDLTSHGFEQECVSLVKVVDGTFELIGDPQKPFLCWDNTKTEWSEPVATNFE